MSRTRVLEPPTEYREALAYLRTHPEVEALLDRIVPYDGPEEWLKPDPGTDVREPQIVSVSRRFHWFTSSARRLDRIELQWPNVAAVFRLDETGSLRLDDLDVEDDDYIAADGSISIIF